MISQKLIDEFKKIYKEDYGVSLTDSQASEIGNNLVGFFELLLKMDQRNKQKDYEQKQKVQS